MSLVVRNLEPVNGCPGCRQARSKAVLTQHMASEARAGRSPHYLIQAAVLDLPAVPHDMALHGRG